MAEISDSGNPATGRRRRNFIVQQGFPAPDEASCDLSYGALLFQPRVVLGWTVVALLLSSAPLFATLGAMLGFSAAFPRLNPFEAIHNGIVARRGRGILLGPAPAPRRFSQLLGGALSLAVALLFRSGHHGWALAVGALFLAFVIALAVGGFCFGSFLWHVFRGRARFAWRSAPWGAGPS